MKRFNLLREIKSIRNTVRPDTPIPGTPLPFWRRSSFIAMVVFVAVIVSGLWYIGAEVTINLDVFTSSAEDTREPAPRPVRQAPPVVNATAAKDKRAQTPKPPEEKKRAGKKAEAVKASKEKTAKEPEKAIPRPAAREISQEKDVRVAKDVWSVRFAVCLFRKSCEDVAADLKKKGVETHMAKGEADILTHQVIAGPWKDAADAESARKKLGGQGVEAAVFTAERGHYISTGSFPDKRKAVKIRDELAAHSVKVKISSKREPKEVYKLYAGSFDAEAPARVKLLQYRENGLDCVIEKR